MSTTLKLPAASRWFAASAGALAVAMTMGLSAPASATECLLDTNNDGVVGPGDTDGKASSGGGPDSLACGPNATTSTNSIAVGPGAQAPNAVSVVVGSNASTVGNAATTIGANSVAGTNGSAIGFGANAILGNDVAIGANTVTDRANTVAVGNRQITQVAAGTVGTDAVNLNQLNVAAANVATNTAGIAANIRNSGSLQRTGRSMPLHRVISAVTAGDGALASGSGATAVGASAFAPGTNGSAYGSNARRAAPSRFRSAATHRQR